MRNVARSHPVPVEQHLVDGVGVDRFVTGEVGVPNLKNSGAQNKSTTATSSPRVSQGSGGHWRWRLIVGTSFRLRPKCAAAHETWLLRRAAGGLSSHAGSASGSAPRGCAGPQLP